MIICYFSYFDITFPSAQPSLLLAPNSMSIISTNLLTQQSTYLFATASPTHESLFKVNHRQFTFYPTQDMFVEYIDQ